MKIIFLDIDGVLNNHTKHPNGYCGIDGMMMARFNTLLDDANVRIVLSGAWRYMIIKETMTITGFNNMMMTHGLKSKVIVDHTSSDEYIPDRVHQIKAWLKSHADWGVTQHVILDDLDLTIDHFVHVDGKIGLTPVNINQAKRLLT